MARAKFKIRKPNNLRKHLDAVSEAVKLGALEGTMKIAGEVAGEARKLIRSGQKTGVKYPSLPNRSSAPGESPATQSGKLAKSIRTRRNKNSARIVVESKYGLALEFGTTRIKPRPFLRPAVLRVNGNKNRSMRKLAREIEARLRRVSRLNKIG